MSWLGTKSDDREQHNKTEQANNTTKASTDAALSLNPYQN